MAAERSSWTEVQYVRFGSLADICAAKSDVCFTPIATSKSGLALTVMSAFPLKADMCSAK